MFNQEVAVYFLWVENRPMLHAVCIHATFQGAVVLHSKNFESIVSSLTKCWCSVYTGYPIVMRV